MKERLRGIGQDRTGVESRGQERRLQEGWSGEEMTGEIEWRGDDRREVVERRGEEWSGVEWRI